MHDINIQLIRNRHERAWSVRFALSLLDAIPWAFILGWTGFAIALAAAIILTIEYWKLAVAFYVGLVIGVFILGLCQAGARGMRE
jgi:ABC-type multidrug transport system permease subunit